MSITKEKGNVRKQLREVFFTSSDKRVVTDNDLDFWENLLHAELRKIVEAGEGLIIAPDTRIPTSASCFDLPGDMNYVIGVIDKQGHPYCPNCGVRENTSFTPTQLIHMFPEQSQSLLKFFHDHEGIVNLRQSLDG